MLQETYVSFEIAKLLKEKGFDERLDTVYSEYGELHRIFDKEFYENTNSFITIANSYYNDITKYKYDFFVTAPTLQMVMKWLREIYNIVIVIDVCRETGREGFYGWQLENNCTGDWIDNLVGECPTYEQACDAAIKYCLENLIK